MQFYIIYFTIIRGFCTFKLYLHDVMGICTKLPEYLNYSIQFIFVCVWPCNSKIIANIDIHCLT